MRILVTGAGGMVGREVLDASTRLGWEGVGRTHAELDVGDRAAVRAEVATVRPDVVINAAAYTRVDEAERVPGLARRVNTEGPAWLAEACAAGDVPLIHLSSDYVFDGRGRRPYRPDDPAAPLGVYGRTKWEGEQAVRECPGIHLIVRTSWVYAPHGRNFFRTIARLANQQETLPVVADQHGCPTLAGDLADALLDAGRVVRERPAVRGTYHFCNAGETTWYGFATAIVAGLSARSALVCRRVVPIATAERPGGAPRPAYSVLDATGWGATFGREPRPWQDALADALCRLK